MAEAEDRVTELLLEWSRGDSEALQELTPLVYAELRRVAEGYLRKERPGHTLQPTELVHEAFLRLVAQSLPDWDSRSHFYGIAARLMRQILVDYARHNNARKRDGGLRVAFPVHAAAQDHDYDVLSLENALGELERIDPRKAKVIELRFFAGLSVDETAQAAGISIATVHRELRMAETWLYSKLNPERA